MTGVAPYYYSDRGFTTGVGHAPASTYFEPRVLQPLAYSESIIGRDRIAGGVAGAGGFIELDNSDGELDDLLLTHAIDGRRVVVKVGAPDFDYDDFETVFDGLADGWRSTEKRVRIDLRDTLADLDLPIQGNLYAGSGGLEGGDDLKDKPKPLLFGVARGIAPTLVDSTNLIYQVHDGVLQNVGNAYDRGVALTEVTSGLSAGEYQEDLPNGTFQLGGTPAGTVTANARTGPASPGGTFMAVLDLVLAKAGISTSQVHAFDRANFPSTADLGIYIAPAQRTRRSVIDELLVTVGGWLAAARSGSVLRVGVFTEPAGVPEFELTAAEIVAIEQELPPAGVYPPNWRRRVGYQKNYTLQNDIAAGATAAQRAFASQEFRIRTSSDAAVKTKHLYATDPEFIPALFEGTADALAESARLLGLYKGERRLYRVRTKYSIFEYRLGQLGKLTYPRWDLEAGKLCRVAHIDLDAARNECSLMVFS